MIPAPGLVKMVSAIVRPRKTASDRTRAAIAAELQAELCKANEALQPGLRLALAIVRTPAK